MIAEILRVLDADDQDIESDAIGSVVDTEKSFLQRNEIGQLCRIDSTKFPIGMIRHIMDGSFSMRIEADLIYVLWNTEATG